MAAIIGLVPRKVSSPLFVGREAELDRFAATIAAARDGAGQLLLVAGEAGVGKSRLLEEAVRRASADGMLVASGRCFGPGSSSVPFGPIREALRAVAAAAGGPSDGTGARPSIDAFLPVGLESVLAPERIGLGPDTSQARAFEACLELLRAASRDRPVLLVVEDVHWADRSTLDLLGFLAAGLSDAQIVLVASFRSDELYRGHPLQAFLGEVQRSRATERIDLARFTRDEAARQVSAILGEAARDDVVDRVFQRSDGIAFYIEEVLAAETGGTGLPPAMRDILLARVAALSVPTQELLQTVAAGGLRIPTAVVARVAEVGPEAVARFVREASDRHLVTVGDADGIEFVAFRHALVQEAVYAELLPGERSRLHVAYATALESAGAFWQDPAAQLAYHWFAAHDIPRALAASVEAGRRAAAGYAYADAHAHYERALELWDRVPDAAERTGLDRIALLELGASVAAQSDPARAAALLREAVEAVQAAGSDADRTRVALLKERYARYAWMAGDGVTAMEACREAATLIPDDAPMDARARVLASLGQILMVTRPTDEARPVSERAVAAARAAGDAEIEAHALDTLGVINVYLGSFEQGRSQVEAAIDLGIRIGSVDEASRAKSNLVDVLAHSALLSEVEDATVSAYAYALQHGLARNMGVFALAEGGLALYRYGRWDRAEELFAIASQHAPSGAPLIMVQERLALIDVGRGRFDAAAARFAVARALIDRVVEAQFVSPMAEAAAELALWRGDPLGARAEIAALFDRLDVVPAYISRLGPLLALSVRAEADASEVARPRRDAAALAASDAIVRAHLDVMRALHAEAAGRRRNFLSQADSWLALCEAEAARQAGSDESAVWARAAVAFEAIPMPYPAAYARWRRAAAILAVSRDRSAAAAEARTALDGAQALGARPLFDAIEGLVARARLELVPHVRVASARLPGDELGLTRREREILALVAIGRSNRQIAEALFSTEGTAGTHVSNILAKLGVRGRTEAASLAHRLGIVAEG
jgi:DNA-binding NarL/FixJ family response regulator/tetratricopeptide (TPR) repeat protein